MKREILFKAKRFDNDEWVIGSLSIEYDNSCFIHYWVSELTDLENNYREMLCLDFQVKPETVCQFTGLNDNSGNKIFEGDKLESIKYGNAYIVYVEDMGMFGMKPEDSEEIDFDLWMYCNYAIITSNIYNND